jgi:hypothetical protein
MVTDFTRPGGGGTTTLVATPYIPSPGPRPPGAPNLPRALATVELDQGFFGQSAEVTHLDFMDTGNVRIDDDPGSLFGSFPFDQPFSLFLSNEVTSASSATAHVTLLAGASGQADRPNRFRGIAAASTRPVLDRRPVHQSLLRRRDHGVRTPPN